jgi:protein-tyrosine phosphatase
MKLDQIILQYPGRLFRSPMPFSGFDTHDAWDAYRAEKVDTVVMLASSEECRRVTGIDLPEFYRTNDLNVIYAPIADFGILVRLELQKVVSQVLEALEEGRNVAVHCHAGRGRTGMLLACILRAAEGIDGEEAIERIREIVPGAIETPAQVQVVMEFSPEGGQGDADP